MTNVNLKNITDKVYKTTGKDEVQEQIRKARTSKAATPEKIQSNLLSSGKLPKYAK